MTGVRKLIAFGVLLVFLGLLDLAGEPSPEVVWGAVAAFMALAGANVGEWLAHRRSSRAATPASGKGHGT